MKINSIFGYSLLFVVLILLQVLIFNHIRFGGYINPYIYILFVMLLPIDVRGGTLLIMAFLTGLSIDMFLDSLGMHAAATLCMAFTRPAVIRLISVRSDFEPGTVPSISNQGPRWIITYAVLLILAHHIPLFFLEIFRFNEFFSTFGRILLSSLFSFIFVIIGFFILDKSPGIKD